MSKGNEQIKEQLAIFSSKYSPEMVLTAEVKQIQEDGITIAVELPSGEVIDDVRMKATVTQGNKFVIVPAIDSTVLIARIGDSEEYYLLAVSAVQAVQVVIGNTVLLVNEQGFQLQRQAVELKGIISELCDNLKAVSAQLQQVVVAIGVSPNVPALQAIDTAIDGIKNKNDNLFI